MWSSEVLCGDTVAGLRSSRLKSDPAFRGPLSPRRVSRTTHKATLHVPRAGRRGSRRGRSGERCWNSPGLGSFTAAISVTASVGPEREETSPSTQPSAFPARPHRPTTHKEQTSPFAK